MAIIAMFYGIIVSMYFFDSRRHKLPHIHVKYQGEEAVLPSPKAKCWKGKSTTRNCASFRHGLKSIMKN